ncbi:MAG: Mur ligase family protein, partial [Planctomycetaceae bacterium]
MIRVSLEQLLRATGGEAVEFDRRDAAFTGIGIDSRTVRPGELFWAIQGERHDGHHFVAEAMKQGAAGAVISAAAVEATNGPRIVVHKTLSALGRFARWHRRRGRARIVGVTGSVGKTTTREMIHAVLAAEKQGTRSPRNWNNHVGLPLSLLDVEPDHDFAVLELGASRIGEIRELARIAGPEIGVVTAIGLGHLQGFG